MKKKFLSILLATLMVVSLLPTVALATETAGLDNFKKVQTYTDGQFTDVKAKDWFAENVEASYELNLMVGRSGKFFDTESNLTVAEAMTIAARLREIYYTGKAEFTQGQPWYKVYTDYCKENKIADPADYDLNKAITRGQFAEIFSKAFPAKALKKINNVQDNMIPDVSKTDKFSAAIYLLYRAGILTGNDSKGTFASDTNIRRIEAAAITTRMAQPTLRKSITLVKQSSGGGGSYTPRYTITFDANGHGTAPAAQTIRYGNKITKPADLTATGYTFGGWFKEATCENEWNFATDKVTKNTTLYAKWTANTYSITYKDQGDADFSGTHGENYPQAHTYGTATALVAPTKAGYIFGGWYTESDCSSDAITSLGAEAYTADITLYAKWTVNTYSITYKDQGDADFSGTHGEDCPATHTYGTATALVTPTKTGYTFGGWYTESDCSSDAITSLGATDYTADITLYAKWIINKYTVNFDLNGIDGDAPNAQTIEYDNKVTKPADPTDTLHTFAGWYKTKDATTGALSDPWDFNDDTVTADMTLYAQWTRTVASILETNSTIPQYPYTDPPEGAWENNEGDKAYIYNNTITAFYFCDKEGENGQLISNGVKFTKVGDTYVRDIGFAVITFHMTNGVFTSADFSASKTDYECLNGTYTAPAAPKYMDWDADKKELVEKEVPADAIEVTNDTTSLDDGEFYVVKGKNITTGTLTVNGTATLILMDGANLTATGANYSPGIKVALGKTLVITGQKNGTGILVANCDEEGAGIGGGADGGDGGTVTINGGTVIANGGGGGAGIGGGNAGAGGIVTINGGTVTANGGIAGAGIGGGNEGKGGTVTINGGTVTANGGQTGAGIGGGFVGNGGTVTINGGTVTATGGDDFDEEDNETVGEAIGMGVCGSTSGTVTFGEGVNFTINAGADEEHTSSMTPAAYSSNHSAAYVGIEEVKATQLPAGALSGEFSVSATKKVHFSQGNLYWDGDSFELETNQYDVQSSWSTSHVSHFFWSKDASVAYAESYSESSPASTDVFFTNATAETAKSDFTVNGVTGKYRTLSTEEWQYLINMNGDENIRKGKHKYGVTVCEKANCLILAPDDFEGTIAESYDAAAWESAEAAGLVCLSSAGYCQFGVSSVGVFGNYWSSTAFTNDLGYYIAYKAYYVSFGSNGILTGQVYDRDYGYSVRLVTEVK